MKHKEWAIPQSFLAIACAVLMMVFSGQIFAQAGIDTGNVTGTVTDQTGAIVQKAQCTLTNVNTGTTQKAISTSAGVYSFTLVPVGTYSLQIAAQGFEDSVVNGIIIHLGNTVTEDVRLHVGAASVSITVNSNPPLLQSQDAWLGMTIDSTAATELPIFGGSGGRSFMTLITIAPGVQFTGSNSSTGTFLIHGMQSGAVDVRVNGADDNAEVFGGITIPPIPDTIQELKVQTGDNPTELGHSYGTIVNVVTKQGTNKFEGECLGIQRERHVQRQRLLQQADPVLHSPTPCRTGRAGSRRTRLAHLSAGPVMLPGL